MFPKWNSWIYHQSLTRLAKFLEDRHSPKQWGCGAGLTLTLSVGTYTRKVRHLENYLAVFIKIMPRPAQWSSIPTLKYIFKRNECIDPPRHSRTVTAVLFTVILNWKQPRCPKRKWMNKLWYIHRVQYCSAMKQNKLFHTATWMNHTDIILSERNKSQKTIEYRIHLGFISWSWRRD